MLKQLLEIIPKKYVVVGVLTLIITLLALSLMKKYIYYIMGGLALLALVFFAGRWTAPKKVETVYDSIKVYRDTCITQTIIADLVSEDTFIQEQAVKKGKPKRVKESPVITQVVVQEEKTTTHFSKDYNWGLIKLNIDFDVEHESPIKLKDFEVEYTLDTVVLNNNYVKTTTVVVRDSADESFTRRVERLPVSIPYREIGVDGGIQYTDKLIWDIGPYYETPTGFRIKPAVLFEKTNPVGASINISTPITKIKK